MNFVRQWSGGENGQLLHMLEKFERSLDVKRKISADDLEAMAKLRAAEAPIFILALACAMLCAPPKFSTVMGESTLVSPQDYAGLAPGGKYRAKMMRAAKLMATIREFTDAYSHVDEVKRMKHISTFDVRLVMHVLFRRRACRGLWGGGGEGEGTGAAALGRWDGWKGWGVGWRASGPRLTLSPMRAELRAWAEAHARADVGEQCSRLHAS